MAELTEEEIDAKFKQLFPEEDFKPEYTSPKQSEASVTLGPITDVSPTMEGLKAGAVGFALGKPIQRGVNALAVPVSKGTPDIPSKPYTNAWGTKTGYGIGEGTTRQQSEAYKEANPNKKLERGNIKRRWNVNTLLEEMAKREALASEAVKGDKAKYLQYLGEKLGLVQSAIPRYATGLGAFGAGYEGTEAYNRYKHGDYPGAVIAGTGALGSALTLAPHPVAKAVGAGLGIAEPFVLGAYDKYINSPK
jgi:hypothetical protein